MKRMRQAPTESATRFAVGTRQRGNDGNMWEVVLTSNDVQRWKKDTAPRPTPKRVSPQRKSPDKRAKDYPVGTRMLGNDGNVHEVMKTSNDVYRWRKVAATAASSSGVSSSTGASLDNVTAADETETLTTDMMGLSLYTPDAATSEDMTTETELEDTNEQALPNLPMEIIEKILLEIDDVDTLLKMCKDTTFKPWCIQNQAKVCRRILELNRFPITEGMDFCKVYRTLISLGLEKQYVKQPIRLLARSILLRKGEAAHAAIKKFIVEKLGDNTPLYESIMKDELILLLREGTAVQFGVGVFKGGETSWWMHDINQIRFDTSELEGFFIDAVVGGNLENVEQLYDYKSEFGQVLKLTKFEEALPLAVSSPHVLKFMLTNHPYEGVYDSDARIAFGYDVMELLHEHDLYDQYWSLLGAEYEDDDMKEKHQLFQSLKTDDISTFKILFEARKRRNGYPDNLYALARYAQRAGSTQVQAFLALEQEAREQRVRSMQKAPERLEEEEQRQIWNDPSIPSSFRVFMQSMNDVRACKTEMSDECRKLCRRMLEIVDFPVKPDLDVCKAYMLLYDASIQGGFNVYKLLCTAVLTRVEPLLMQAVIEYYFQRSHTVSWDEYDGWDFQNERYDGGDSALIEQLRELLQQGKTVTFGDVVLKDMIGGELHVGADASWRYLHLAVEGGNLNNVKGIVKNMGNKFSETHDIDDLKLAVRSAVENLNHDILEYLLMNNPLRFASSTQRYFFGLHMMEMLNEHDILDIYWPLLGRHYADRENTNHLRMYNAVRNDNTEVFQQNADHLIRRFRYLPGSDKFVELATRVGSEKVLKYLKN